MGTYSKGQGEHSRQDILNFEHYCQEAYIMGDNIWWLIQDRDPYYNHETQKTTHFEIFF